MSLKPSPSIPYLADGVLSPVAQARTLKSSFLLLPPWVSHPRSHHILSKLHPRYPTSSSQTATKAPVVHVLFHFRHILSVLARYLLLKRAPTTYLLTFLMCLFHEDTWSKNHLPLMCLDLEDTETDSPTLEGSQSSRVTEVAAQCTPLQKVQWHLEGAALGARERGTITKASFQGVNY